MSKSKPKSKSDHLMSAIRKGDAETVRRMLDPANSSNNDEDSSLNPNMSADSAENRILHRAARFGNLNVVKVLLDLGANCEQTNKFGMTPLHHAAVAGEVEISRALVESGADPKVQDDAGRTPLHWASGYAFLELVQFLLEAGAKAEVVDKEGWTPLHRCCQEKPPQKKEASQEEQEADQEQVEKASIEEEDSKRVDIATLLLEKGAVGTTREPKGLQTPLHLCAMNGYAKTAEALITKGGAEIDAPNKISQTPLMYACAEGHLEVIKVLIAHKADLNFPNKLHWDWTALHTATLQDNVKAIELLLGGGADPSRTDGVGRTPKQLADEHEKKEVLRYFEKLKIK